MDLFVGVTQPTGCRYHHRHKQLKQQQMRQIEFRGLRVDGMGWAYGFIGRVQNDDSTYDYLISEDTTRHQRNVRRCVFMVHPESVGQFTGLYDRNGVKVFEGDNVTINGKEYFIRFNMGVFVAESVTANHLSLLPWECNGTDITVTGNIHEPATVRE